MSAPDSSPPPVPSPTTTPGCACDDCLTARWQAREKAVAPSAPLVDGGARGEQEQDLGKTAKSEPAAPNQQQEPVPSRDATVSAAWVVWSNYHHAWWGPERSGYTPSLLGAGFYTEAEARRIASTRSHELGAPPPEVAIPLADALDVERRARTSSAKVVDLMLAAMEAR